MRKFWMLAAASALALAGGAVAQDRDTPPPGCRWFGDDLGCKDGRGNYRRAGDGEILGSYAISRPRPKPAPRPAATVLETPPSAADAAAPDIAEAAAPSTPFDLSGGGPPSAAAEAAPEPVAAPTPPPQADPAPPVATKPKPWWQAFWEWLVNDIMSLLRRLGLAK